MKAYDLPISRAALKMLKRDFGYQRFLKYDGRHLTISKNPGSQCRDYLNRTEPHQVRITVICRHASPIRLYYIAKTIEHTFDQSLLIYVEAAVENKIPAAEAIQKFMDKYDISEEDLQLSSAYKRWQRHVKREKKRELIPLW